MAMGRPVGSLQQKPFKDAIRKAILETDGDTRRLDRIARKLALLAEKGDLNAIREVMDRVDGRVTHTVGGDQDTGPITIKWKE